MTSTDYSILIGAKGEEGLTGLIKMIRFDQTMQVYIVPVNIVDETFAIKPIGGDGTIEYNFKFYRKVSIRQGHNVYSTDIFHSEDYDIYYMSVARIAPYLRKQTEHFLKTNINGKYKNYFLENIAGTILLVKGLRT